MNYDVNIARDLANAPYGLRLWSPLFGQCRLEKIEVPAEGGWQILVSTVKDNGEVRQLTFGNDGKFFIFNGYSKSECMLFPDEYKRWEEWQYSCFRRSVGFVITSIDERSVNHTFLITSQDSCIRAKNPTFNFELEYKCKGYRYATPPEREEFFRELAEAGYEWDINSMKLVKLPSKEKEDYDKCMERNAKRDLLKPMNITANYDKSGISNEEFYKGVDTSNRKCGNSVYTKVLHPKYKVGDYIVAEHDGEILIGPEMITEVLANKYMLGDDPYPILLVDSDNDFRLAKPCEIAEVTNGENDGIVDCDMSNTFGPALFKPFDKVLGRHSDDDEWQIDFFDTEDPTNNKYRYCCINNFFAQCVPYNENTAHLHHTTDKADEEYVRWEK